MVDKFDYNSGNFETIAGSPCYWDDNDIEIDELGGKLKKKYMIEKANLYEEDAFLIKVDQSEYISLT